MERNANVLLTKERKDVLNGDYDGAENTERSHKYNIQEQSQTAIDELIEVARSPHIENEKAIPAEKVGELVEALYIPLVEHSEQYPKDVYYHVRRAIETDIEELADE